MADWYNLSLVNASNVLELAKSVNEVFMFEQLGALYLLAIFAITFISFTYFNNNPRLNMMFSSFTIAIFSIFFRIFGLVNDTLPYFCWGLFAVSIMIVQFTR